MSTLAIVLIVVAGVLLLLLLAGLLAIRRRERLLVEERARHIAAADHALEAARAADRGWDRAAMDGVARAAIAERRPGFSFVELHLILVDDRPGVEEDRAHFLAVGGGEEVSVVLTRHHGGDWIAGEVG
jgi:hypothetical protein